VVRLLLTEAAGIEVYLVNARHVRYVPGRKTDVQDSQWLRQLHRFGLLNASFRPQDLSCRLRSLHRHRDRRSGVRRLVFGVRG
jgi:transposase